MQARAVLIVAAAVQGAVQPVTPPGTQPAATPGAPAGQAEPEGLTPVEIRRLLDQAWRRGDDAGVYDTLTKAWADQPATARQICGALLTSETVSVQPVGAALLCAHASPADLAQAARALSASGYPEARRMLVRALGSRDPKVAADLAASFLDDRDLKVRAAAIAACADLGRVDTIGDLLSRLQAPPAQIATWDGDDDAILDMAMHGAVRVLTGLRPTTAAEVAQWWRGANRTPVTASQSDPAEELLSGVSRGQRYFITPNFNVYLRVEGIEQPSMGQSGPLSWPQLTRSLEQASAAACEAAAPIFGRVHLPVLRVIVCDERQFAPHAGLSFMGGVAKGNEVVLRLGTPEAMRGTMAHEMVHIVQGAMYERQPRWLSEGLAESLARSAGGSLWTSQRVRAAGLDRDVARGALGEAIGWTSGASSGSREGQRYALAYLAVDFLRFGGFCEPAARMHYLMGMLDRGVPAAQAIEAVYGQKVRDLDQRLRQWVSPEG